MKFAGSKLDATVNDLISSMMKNGYISDDANCILVSVDSNDQTVGQKLQTKLMTEISSIIKDGNVEGAILAQTVSKDEDIQKLAVQKSMYVLSNVCQSIHLVKHITYRVNPILTFVTALKEQQVSLACKVTEQINHPMVFNSPLSSHSMLLYPV